MISPSQSTITIRCTDLSKRFGEVQAVDGVNLSLRSGQFMALLGPSGCGKTSTLRLIAGFETPDSGTIEIGGDVVSSPKRFIPPERRSIGMVFQEYALFPHLSVGENIAFGLGRGVDKRARTAEALELVGLPNLEARLPHELSGGQQQRIALARALAPNPALILLDEPFSNLDASLRVQVRSEIRRILRQVEATVVFVTHDQEEALSLADEVAVMMDGAIAQVDAPQRLYRHPTTRAVAEFVGDTNFLQGEARSDVVDCALGQLPLAQNLTGKVDVMLRPEDIQLDRAEDGEVEIIDRQYFGHDQLVHLRLATGQHLQSRMLSSAGDFEPGQRANVKILDHVIAYEASF